MPFVAYQKDLQQWPDLASFIDQKRFRYAILEKVDAIKFLQLNDDTIATHDFQEYNEGLLFGLKTELRWRKRRSGLHLVIISDETSDILPSGFTVYDEDLQLGDRRAVYLWGEKQFDTNSNEPKPQRVLKKWFEMRIPRILEYPMENVKNEKDRIVAVIRDYKVEDTLPDGEKRYTILHRWVDIKEVDPEKITRNNL